ncbi:MAG: CBS domain-containing protein [Gammaproteobacteria bacterium]|nr:CBS domain-containing protein [Gammaproteobacteria bacterium]
MKQNEPVSKIMSSNLKTIHTGQKLSEVRRLLTENPFDHVPVVSGDKLVGILSSADLMRLTFDAGNTDPRSMDAVLDSQFTIEGTMTKDPVTIRGGDTIREAAELLVKSARHSLPVLTESGKLVGIVTSTDLINYLLEQY